MMILFILSVEKLWKIIIDWTFYLDETVYGNAGNRRKSVFAEAYNPEEDDGVDEVKVNIRKRERDVY